MSRIPQVNLNDYLSGDTGSKEKFIKELGKGFSEIGFVAVKGHLLNDEVKDSLYKEVKQFFNLPDSINSLNLTLKVVELIGDMYFGQIELKNIDKQFMC